MRLELESGKVIDEVKEADLRGHVEGEEFAILWADKPLTYIQGAEQKQPPYEYVLEYQKGSIKRHYEATDHPVTLERVLSAFAKYLRGDPSWRRDFRWRRMDLSQAPKDDEDDNDD